MDGHGGSSLVRAALRCYPPSWRLRHGNEAADLAALLIEDGTPVCSITCSYLAGAAREWVTPWSGRRLSAVTCALLVAAGLICISAALLAQTAPARAASTTKSHARYEQCSVEPSRSVAASTGSPQTLNPRGKHVWNC